MGIKNSSFYADFKIVLVTAIDSIKTGEKLYFYRHLIFFLKPYFGSNF
jgi:hypothetical protein